MRSLSASTSTDRMEVDEQLGKVYQSKAIVWLLGNKIYLKKDVADRHMLPGEEIQMFHLLNHHFEYNNLGIKRRQLKKDGKLRKQFTDLAACLDAGMDFGTVYALLRARWLRVCPCGDSSYVQIHHDDGDVVVDKSSVNTLGNPEYPKKVDSSCSCLICTYRVDELKWQSSEHHALSQQATISDPYSIPPRRVWDLNANRVIPFSATEPVECPACHSTSRHPGFHAISHSWVSKSNLDYVVTPVNQRQWEVPMPRGVKIDAIRFEMIDRTKALYCWLDILCLRQRRIDQAYESLRQIEWSADVPTIGNVYKQATGVMRYFNGLGITFTHGDPRDSGNLNIINSRHWLRRAWTLQEVRQEQYMFIGGVPDNIPVPMNTNFFWSGRWYKLRTLCAPLAMIANECSTPDGCSIYRLLQEMMKREATNEIDKVSGISYLLHGHEIPKYQETEDIEDAWRKCIGCLRYMLRLELLFNCPFPRPRHLQGENLSWMPMWRDMIHSMNPIVPLQRPKVPEGSEPSEVIVAGTELNVLRYKGGFAIRNAGIFKPDGSNDNYMLRIRSSVFNSNKSVWFYNTHPSQDFPTLQEEDDKVTSNRSLSIPDGNYLLLTPELTFDSAWPWVVCEKVATWNLEADLETWGPHWQGFAKCVPENVLLVRKIGTLMTDESRNLLSDAESMNYLTDQEYWFI